MSKKLYALLLPVIAVAALAIGAGSAQAAFHWYSCVKNAGAGTKFNNEGCTATGATNEFEMKRLPFNEKETTPVDTFGTLTLVGSNGLQVKCSVIDAGNIWNVTELTQGKDEITQFVNFNCTSNSETCKAPTIEAKDLPWPTELGAGPIDTIGTVAKPIEVTLKCGTESFTFKGELKPKVINPTVSDPMIVEFVAASGTLTGPGTLTATVTGQDRVVGFAHGENIFVKEP
jgi:hypothetical protein